MLSSNDAQKYKKAFAMLSNHSSIYYTLIPVVTVLLALGFGLSIKPKGLLINIIQALAAGTLLCVVASELLPQIKFAGNGVSLSLALTLGMLLMIGLSRLNPGCCGSDASKTPLTPFVAGFSLEFFINGIVIVLSVLAGHFASIIAALSLSACCFVCGLSITTRFISVGFSTRKTIISVFFMALAFPAGGIISYFLLTRLANNWIQDIIAFSIAVLLYIATADLLKEGFKPKSSWPKVSFYAGFLLILLVKAYLN